MRVRIVNVVSTADLKQRVDLEELNNHKWGRYGFNVYPAGYIKDNDTQGRVTVFHTGKLISVGAPSLRASFHNLTHAKELLLSAGMIGNVALKPQVRNMVGDADLGHEVNLFELAETVPNMMYEPEQFPGLILRRKGSSVTLLIFASGRIVIAGAKTTWEISQAAKLTEEMVAGGLRSGV